MTAQERINQLANAALRAAPPTASIPKPATYMAPFEKPKARNLVPVAKPAVEQFSEAEAKAFVPVAAAAVEVQPLVHQSDPNFSAMIDDRDGKMKKKLGRQSLFVSFSVLALLVGGGVAISLSPKAKASVETLIPALKQSVGDVKMIGSMTSQYDESLEQVSAHGSRIGDASAALGIDPASVTAEEDQELQAEMANMMGDGAVTTGDRDKLLKEKYGFVGKLAGKQAAPGQ